MGQKLTSGFLTLTRRDVTSSRSREDALPSVRVFSWERASSKVTGSGQTLGLSLRLSSPGMAEAL